MIPFYTFLPICHFFGFTILTVDSHKYNLINGFAAYPGRPVSAGCVRVNPMAFMSLVSTNRSMIRTRLSSSIMSSNDQ